MAVKTMRNQLTLVELAKRVGDGNILEIAEILEQTNEMLEDAVWLEANMGDHHLITVRTSLPSGSWRLLNKGVPPEASSTRQIKEGIGMLESYSKVDAKLVKISPDGPRFRSQEDMAFVEGMSQTLQETLIYGNVDVNPEQFDGLANRYSAAALANVHDGGGTGSDLTSVWIIQWGRTRVHMIYPRGHRSMGVQVTNLGEDTVQDADGNEYQAFRTHFEINGGLCVRDDRCVQRYANIETAGSTNIFDENFLIDALTLMLQRGKGSIIYGNRTIQAQIDKQANIKTNVYYTVGEEFGRPVSYFRGIPVKLVEKLVNTEDQVT